MTDPQREAREAGRPRPGIIYPLPRAARPDTRLAIDTALPEAAVLDRHDPPPTVMDIPGARQTTENRLPEPSQPRKDRACPGASPANSLGTTLVACTSLRSAHHTAVTGVSRLLSCYKQWMMWSRQEDRMTKPRRKDMDVDAPCL